MSSGCEECPDYEHILRAITEVYWDPKNNKCSSSLMRGPDTSVSRLAKLSFEQICRIFIDDLHKPPDNLLLFAGEIKIEHLKYIGITYSAKKTEISVLKKPLEDNRAHSEIPQRLSKGLARKIANELILRDLP